ncbi:MAG: recombinase family protein [Actinomycetota bacterium]|nr:recombinase family protein [Actinomycetota bacterium]
MSSDEQRERQTIETQREFLSDYARVMELEVVDTYPDDGVLGTIPLEERSEGRRLLKDAKAGKFGTVLVYKLDRLGRTLLVIVEAHDKLAEIGVGLRSPHEAIDTSTPHGRFAFQTLASVAELERENIRTRTRDGLHRAFRAGKYMGVVPYGYVANKDARLEIVPEEAEVVRKIFGHIVEGASLYSVAKDLNEGHIPPPGKRYGSGKRRWQNRWAPTTVRNIIHQRAYSGIHEVTLGGSERVERPVPAIIDPLLQEQAKAALAEGKRRTYQREGNRKYLLSGLVRCAICGYGCSGHANTAKGKRRSYYTCITNMRAKVPQGGPHGAPYIRAEWLEEEVWSDVRRFLENPGEVLDRVRAQIESDDEIEQLKSECERLERVLANLRDERLDYLRQHARGAVESEEELDTLLTDVRGRTENTRLLLENVEVALEGRRERRKLADSAAAWLATLRERLSEVEEDTETAYLERRQLVKLLVANITVGRREDGRRDVRATYRFGPPSHTEAGREDAYASGIPSDLSYSLPHTSH